MFAVIDKEILGRWEKMYKLIMVRVKTDYPEDTFNIFDVNIPFFDKKIYFHVETKLDENILEDIFKSVFEDFEIKRTSSYFAIVKLNDSEKYFSENLKKLFEDMADKDYLHINLIDNNHKNLLSSNIDIRHNYLSLTDVYTSVDTLVFKDIKFVFSDDFTSISIDQIKEIYIENADI